jgi:hypothetical protein
MNQQLSTDRILNRAVRVAKLDLPTYREIARDPSALQEAAIIVGLVALASGIGSLTDSFGRVIISIIGAFVWWGVFSAMTYFFGKNIFGSSSTYINVQSLMRTQGYARVPGLLAFFGFIPVLGWMIAVIAWFWGLFTAIVAIRETLIISTGRAIFVGLIALLASAIIVGILGLIFVGSWAF